MSRPTRGSGAGFPVRGSHPLWRAVPGASGAPAQDRWPRPRSLATTDGVSRAPRRTSALGGPLLMSFPPANEMFQFAGFASPPYRFRWRYPRVKPAGGLPHSEIPGSASARLSPGLFAACYVLPRLSVPRHPPDALCVHSHPPRRPQRHAPTSSQNAKRGDARGRPRRLPLGSPHPEGGAPWSRHFSLHLSNSQAAPLSSARLKWSQEWSQVEVTGFEPAPSCVQSRRSPG